MKKTLISSYYQFLFHFQHAFQDAENDADEELWIY